MLMFAAWWYGEGWSRVLRSLGRRLHLILEAFSVSELLGTLFSPFHQISAEQVRGSLSVQFRALGDRLFSRIFGAVIRSIFIIAGLVVAGVVAVMSIVEIVVWPILPLAPLIGLILTFIGWVPAL